MLDTWFSSALWPFSTLGWPEQTPDLKYFYPTDVLVTGYDIIFFWVASMIFSACEHTGKPPFHTVFIHGLVRDDKGSKMSKSLGNGIDPLEIAEQYGADALRFNLITGNSPGNDMRFYTERCEAMRNFANKIWNASRFLMMNLTIEDSASCPRSWSWRGRCERGEGKGAEDPRPDRKSRAERSGAEEPVNKQNPQETPAGFLTKGATIKRSILPFVQNLYFSKNPVSD